MVFNRQSAKTTSRVSLVVAVVMLTSIFFTVQSQGYSVGEIADNGVQMCKLGVVDLFVSLLW